MAAFLKKAKLEKLRIASEESEEPTPKTEEVKEDGSVKKPPKLSLSRKKGVMAAFLRKAKEEKHRIE
jgi:hypothetical protein